MERIQTFFLSVCAASMLVAWAHTITEHTKFRRIVSFSGGLLLLLIVLSPIVRTDQRNLKRMISSAVYDVSDPKEGFAVEDRSQVDQIIMEECREYILDKAEMLGMSVDAIVSLDHTEVVSIPARVRIFGSYSSEQKDALSFILENDLDIPFSNQEWVVE